MYNKKSLENCICFIFECTNSGNLGPQFKYQSIMVSGLFIDYHSGGLTFKSWWQLDFFKKSDQLRLWLHSMRLGRRKGKGFYTFWKGKINKIWVAGLLCYHLVKCSVICNSVKWLIQNKKETIYINIVHGRTSIKKVSIYY